LLRDLENHRDDVVLFQVRKTTSGRTDIALRRLSVEKSYVAK
jgi:hypothetical protein